MTAIIPFGILYPPCGVNESRENQKQSVIFIRLLNIWFWLEFLFRFVPMLYGLQRSITQMSVLRWESNQLVFQYLAIIVYVYLALRNATKMHSQTFHSRTSKNLKSELRLTSRFIKMVRPVVSVKGTVKSMTSSRSDVMDMSVKPISAFWSINSRTIPFH